VGGRASLLGSGAVQHVIIIFQENRTPDNLFHGLPGADIANSGINSRGRFIPLLPVKLANLYDPRHMHADFEAMYDGGKMDGADKVVIRCDKREKICPPPDAQFKYVDPADVQPYFQMAETYAFADRMFQSNQGPSFAAHQFIISGTSAPSDTSALFAAETPQHGSPYGCSGPPNEYVVMIDNTGQENLQMFPCFEHQTLPDLLDNAGISWRYYTLSGGSLWTGPNAIDHLRNGPDWANVIANQNQILTDITAGQLAGVSWVIPDGKESDHAQTNDGSGPSWVASIVNTLGQSAYWANTVIFITWDDWGGWYDHVPPPQVLVNCAQWGCGYVYGFRVPLIVVSPFANPAYVSHVNHDFGSILKFVEEVYGLPSLGFADQYADDLSDCFNFSQEPLKFHPIDAPLGPSHFLGDKRPPTDPDDD
jgi:phospholipase C